MRKLLLLFALIAVSCSSDDDNATNDFTSSDIQGTWNIKSRNVSGTGTKMELNECEKKESITFNIDGTVIIRSSTNDDEPCEFNDFEYTYEVEGTRIWIDGPEVITYRTRIENENMIKVTLVASDDGTTIHDSYYVR